MRNIILIGFMGTGKTSIGKKLADKLDLHFIDTDKEIERLEGKSIAEIFEIHGESYFRELEKEIVSKYCEKNGQVISTGGGVVLDSDNMKKLKAAGVVILLKARPEIIYRNICNNANRPLLNTNDPMKRIIEMLEDRKEYYKNNHYEIDVSDMTADEAVARIIERSGP
jgi:shikimate kinase